MSIENRVGWYWNGENRHANLSPRVGVRVRPTSYGFEWSTWIGPYGARVVHASGETRTRRGAMRAAIREGRRLADVAAYTCAACVRVPHDMCGMKAGCLCCARTAEAVALEGGAP